MTVYSITAVRSAYERALALANNSEAAIYATAQSLALPVQTVREVLPPASPTEGADYPSAHRERVGEGWSA